MLFRTPWKRVVLICVCGWYQIGWKETVTHWSDVGSTQQRSRFGRTNIFPWLCILGMHSKTMWNKQRYCGQLQNHVRIANFSGWNRKTSILRESSYFFMVLWYGGHAKKCGERYCELANKTTQQLYKVSTPCIDHHHFKEEELKSVGELLQVCSQIVLKCLHLARIGRPDILWSVNKLARSIHLHFRRDTCNRWSPLATVHCLAMQDQRDYLLNVPELLGNTRSAWKS